MELELVAKKRIAGMLVELMMLPETPENELVWRRAIIVLTAVSASAPFTRVELEYTSKTVARARFNEIKNKETIKRQIVERMDWVAADQTGISADETWRQRRAAEQDRNSAEAGE